MEETCPKSEKFADFEHDFASWEYVGMLAPTYGLVLLVPKSFSVLNKQHDVFASTRKKNKNHQVVN